MTLIEVLIALVVISIVFLALGLTQVLSVSASAKTKYTTAAKAAANQVLEEQLAQVLEVVTVDPTSDYLDDPNGNRSFWFVDYYWSCPTVESSPPRPRPVRLVSCTGTGLRVGDVEVSYAIYGGVMPPGVSSSLTTSVGVDAAIVNEGVVTITVTASHLRSDGAVTVGNRMTCYDVFPSPKNTTPAPCPKVLTGGGGRS